MNGSSKASMEGKDTKVTQTFNKAEEVKENLRMAVVQAKAIRSKLYGEEPEQETKNTAEVVNKNSFFGKIREELHVMKTIATELRVMLEGINENL